MTDKQDYYGTKRVTAWPEMGPKETDLREGYAVQYADGYTSWSPKAVFEAAYKPITAMGFEGALAAMKEGHKVSRPPALFPVLSLDVLGEWEFDKSDLLADDWMIVPQAAAAEPPGAHLITEEEGEYIG